MIHASAAGLHVAYLVNQYPKVSHSFIRREILALEAAGVRVERYAVRGWQDSVADAQDEAERQRTRYLLASGFAGLLQGVLGQVLRRPGRFLAGIKAAFDLSRGAERSFAYHLIYLAEACVLVGWMREAGVQHLHAHFGTNPAAVALLAQRLGGPGYSFTVHGPEEFDKPTAISLGQKIAAARFVVAISSYGRSQLYRWVPQSEWAKIAVVRCGLDAQFHGAPAAPFQLDAHFVCVGRLCEQKGQLLLIEALHSLRQRGLAVRLTLAGDGEMRAAIEARLAVLGLADHVRITGWISSAQVADEILAARALVLPSFAEGLPVVIMEAMALRRPVISTYVAGIPELVLPGQTGWLVPAGNVEALVEAMVACLGASAAQLEQLGLAGRERALARHDINQEAAQLAAHFRHAVAIGRDA